MRRVHVLILAASLAAGQALRPADCNRNGVEDFGDITSGGSRDCNADGIPDECDIAPVNYGLRQLEETASSAVSNPMSLVIEDLDADGHLDLAMANELSSSLRGGIAVRWNNGDGTLAAAVAFEGADSPRALTAGDLDGDRDIDLAAAGAFAVSTFHRAVSRTFSLARTLPLEFDPVSIDAGDLDGDGDLDLAAAGSFRAAVLRNNGRGAFVLDATFPMGSDPVAVILADLDGDGDLDLVTGNRFDNVSVLLNRRDGSFAEPRNFAAGGPVASLIAADLDGDGRLDLAAANASDHLTILINPGDAMFGNAASFAVSSNSAAILAADLDRDGDLDLAVTDRMEGVSVLLNHGPALFTRPFHYELAPATQSLAAGDLDGDGQLELAAANRNNSRLYLLGREIVVLSLDCNQDGVPDECQLEGNDCNTNLVPDDCDLASGASADCNRNAIPDSCEADCNQNGVPDDCDLRDGTSEDCNQNGIPDSCDVAATNFLFRESSVLTGSRVFSIRSADLDGDHDLDVAAVSVRVDDAGSFVQEVSWLANTGNGNFEPASVLDAGGQDVRALTTGDFDGDADIDLAWAGSAPISVALNRGDGTFAPPVTFQCCRYASRMTSADLDGDADLDLAVADEGNSGLAVLLNEGGASYGEASTYSLEPSGASFVLATDLDRDSYPELVSNGRGGLVVLRNLRDGRFGPAETLGAEPEPLRAAVAADLNADGWLDLAGASTERSILVLLNEGGHFPGVLEHSLESSPSLLTAADLDRDGNVDIAVAATTSSFSSELVALLNEGDGRAFVSRSLTPLDLEIPLDFISFDADGDGDADLAHSALFECPFCNIFGFPDPLRFFLNESNPPASRDRNHNRTPDDCERALFHRGDPTADGLMNLSDPLAVLNFLFIGGGRPSCLETADGNNNGVVDLTDALVLLNFLFLGGPPPAAPGPTRLPCGGDPDGAGSRGDLGCISYPPCR